MWSALTMLALLPRRQIREASDKGHGEAGGQPGRTFVRAARDSRVRSSTNRGWLTLRQPAEPHRIKRVLVMVRPEMGDFIAIQSGEKRNNVSERR
jgi:hypothetical protein